MKKRRGKAGEKQAKKGYAIVSVPIDRSDLETFKSMCKHHGLSFASGVRMLVKAAARGEIGIQITQQRKG